MAGSRRRLPFTFLLAAAASAQSPWTQQQLAADLDQIAAAVREQWSYLDDRRRHSGVDLEALVAAAKAELPAVGSEADWVRVLRRLASGLQDGHAIVRVPGVKDLPSRRLPVRVEPCAEGLVVTAVAGGPGAAVGDLLVALDGVPVAELLARLEGERFGSTPGMRRRGAIENLHGVDSRQVKLALVGKDGELREVVVATNGWSDVLPTSRPVVANWNLGWPRQDVACLRISAFTVPRWQEWLKARPEERDAFLVEGRGRIEAVVAELNARPATALILDLRGNGGGTDSLGIHLAERLLRRPFHYFLLSSRREGRWVPPAGLLYGKGDHERFLGTLVLLVDEGCFSTTDNFARCLTDLHPDVTVVGRPSGAGTGAPRVFVTSTHTKAEFGGCTMRVYGPKGGLIEGRGTVPDVPVTWSREDWIAGRDPDLEAALKLLQ